MTPRPTCGTSRCGACGQASVRARLRPPTNAAFVTLSRTRAGLLSLQTTARNRGSCAPHHCGLAGRPTCPFYGVPAGRSRTVHVTRARRPSLRQLEAGGGACLEGMAVLVAVGRREASEGMHLPSLQQRIATQPATPSTLSYARRGCWRHAGSCTAHSKREPSGGPRLSCRGCRQERRAECQGRGPATGAPRACQLLSSTLLCPAATVAPNVADDRRAQAT